MYRLPGVARVAAVAAPDPAVGERVAIVVVPEGKASLELGAVRAELKGIGVAAYKLPEHLFVVDELPLTKVGKVDKKALREMVAGQLAPSLARSADTAQARPVLLCAVHVLAHPELDPAVVRVGVHRTAARGDTKRHRAGRHHGVFGDERACPDDAAALDACTVQHDGPGADKTAVLHDAAFEVDVVPANAVVAHQGGPLLGGMDDGAVLDRGPRADDDAPVVAAQHRRRPHRRLLTENDVSDKDGVGVHVRVGLMDGERSSSA